MTTVSRAALTLVEVLLVLALLVIIAAVSVPQLAGSISRARLDHGAELLRAAWGQARLAAMESGEVHVFRYQPQGGWYQIVSLASLTSGAQDASALPPENAEDEVYLESDVLRIARHRLPAGVLFAEGQVAAVPSLAAAATDTKGNWSTPILFYADGTASDVSVVLANDRGRQRQVTLRGLTGASRISEATP